MKNRLFRAVAILIPVIAVLLLVFGIRRYGSPENLWRRVDAEVAARQPHPAFAPTPLPVTLTVLPVRQATAAPTATPPEPTVTLPPTPASATPTRPPEPSPVMMTPSPTRPPPAAVVPSPTPSPTVLPPAVRLNGLTHAWQTWNNCGPATLAMNLSYFGLHISQADIAATLRPFKDDKNVNPEELAAYARAHGLAGMARVNGSPERLRQLLAAGVPVLIETWHEPKPNDGMGHYRLLTGYDDAAREWIAFDAYDARGVIKDQPYTGIHLPYAEVAGLWAVFNRAYLVIYDAAHAAAVECILGDDLEDAAMWARATTDAAAAVKQAPADPFAWFNLGTDLVALGRYEEAASAYDRARQIGLPWRMLWYQFGPFRAYYEVGRHDEVSALADATLRSARYVEELFFWRGLAQKTQGDLAGARTSWERALELNPNYVDAREALAAAGN